MTEADLSNQKLHQKQAVGAVAIILLIAFTVMSFLGIISWLVWIIADLIVAGVANLLLRKIGNTNS